MEVVNDDEKHYNINNRDRQHGSCLKSVIYRIAVYMVKEVAMLGTFIIVGLIVKYWWLPLLLMVVGSVTYSLIKY